MPELPKISFDIDFQIGQLALAMSDYAYQTRLFNLVSPDDFNEQKLRWFARKIRNEGTESQSSISVRRLMLIIEREINENEQVQYLQLLDQIVSCDTCSVPSDMMTLVEYAKFKNLEKAFVEGAKKIDSYDLAAAEQIIIKAVLDKPGQKSYDEKDWFETFEDRMVERKFRKENPDKFNQIKTGIPTIDKITGGGIQEGELGLIGGNTGKGKSIFAVHLGFFALLQGKHIIHLTTEMPGFQVASRYDSRFLKIPYSQLKSFDLGVAENEKISRLYRENREILNGRLKIIDAQIRSCDILMLKEIIAKRKVAGIPTDLVIVDSAEHFNAISRFDGSYRLQQSSVFWDLKALFRGEKLAGYSTVQAKQDTVTKVDKRGRAIKNKNLLGEDSASETHDKIRISDLYLTINDGEYPGGMTMFIAKYRDGESHVPVHLSTAFEIMMYKEISSMEHIQKLSEVSGDDDVQME